MVKPLRPQFWKVYPLEQLSPEEWAIIFAVIALIASLLGFGGVAGLSKDFAVILLVIAVILAIVGFISRGRV